MEQYFSLIHTMAEKIILLPVRRQCNNQLSNQETVATRLFLSTST